jgi:hypothetical protein
MDVKEKIKTIKGAVESCFIKGCHSCPFYTPPMHGRPARCMGMKNAGKLILGYLDEIEQEFENGKEKRK